jgi:hypothetical protein
MRLARLCAVLGATSALLFSTTSGAAPLTDSTSAVLAGDPRPAPLADSKLQAECDGRAKIVAQVRVFSEKTTIRVAAIRGGARSTWRFFAVLREDPVIIARQVRVTAGPGGRAAHTFSFHAHGFGVFVGARSSDGRHDCFLYLKNV